MNAFTWAVAAAAAAAAAVSVFTWAVVVVAVAVIAWCLALLWRHGNARGRADAHNRAARTAARRRAAVHG